MTMFDHDYQKYPELTNTELQVLGFSSPFPQIVENFSATVVKVHDGDTVTLRTNFRDFDFPLRILHINAPELNESGGEASRNWLKSMIEGQKVDILIDQNNRVGKYGRLLGDILHQGLLVSEASIVSGHATPFKDRYEGQIPAVGKIMAEGLIKAGVTF